MENPRKNPKRKVSETQEHHGPDDEAADLLLRACSPLTVQDIEDWQGWVELESEPAFFNTILRDLGVRNVKVQELFTMDQDSLDAVSKPVFGLVFLFQYDPAHQNEEQVHDSEAQIWFANQTTNNACATVALLNIIMNAPDIELGQQLTDFKDATKNLDTSLRGHRISSNKFIRSIHNSFTRRIDHLNADLCLENDYDEAQSRAKKKASSAKARQRSGRGKRAALEYGYHFIAYVPCDGLVWELDGLRNKPQEIGPTNGNDWTTVARPQIEAKMLQYEGSQLSFNLLAVCRSSSSQLSQVIATMIAALRTIQSRMKSDTGFTDITSADEPLLNMHDEAQLAEFKIGRAHV